MDKFSWPSLRFKVDDVEFDLDSPEQARDYTKAIALHYAALTDTSKFDDTLIHYSHMRYLNLLLGGLSLTIAGIGLLELFKHNFQPVLSTAIFLGISCLTLACNYYERSTRQVIYMKEGVELSKQENQIEDLPPY